MTAVAGAIFFTALTVIPLLAALARGERVRYIEGIRALEAALEQ